MTAKTNPFITYGYESEEYFCDRRKESAKLTRLLTNGNNVALISPRRMGKTGLLHHCFHLEDISKNYNTFLIDIYATKCLTDMVYKMGQVIVEGLKPWGQKAIDKFLSIVTSLRTGITLDGMGNASWNVGIGEIRRPDFTLEEIFSYLSQAERPCIVAIDEFQAICDYPETNVEATLRGLVQECRNAVFVFSGSQRHLMNEMFSSPARPFYQSVSVMNLPPIALDEYVKFARHHFEVNGKTIDNEVIELIYNKFDATTWYVQKMLNELYSLTSVGECCTLQMVDFALRQILESYEQTYQDMLIQLSAKQVSLLRSISHEGKVKQITGSQFIKKYHLDSASSVQKVSKVLLDKQIITQNGGVYETYDKFMSLWLKG